MDQVLVEAGRPYSAAAFYTAAHDFVETSREEASQELLTTLEISEGLLLLDCCSVFKAWLRC